MKKTAVIALMFLVALRATSWADQKSEKGKLSEKENPLLVGKRDINKGLGNINFYSLEKEVALGQQLAAEVDRQGKFVEDPVVSEYINRLGQNLVLHSDAKVAFTIKVLDSDDVNAFALPGGFFYVNKGLILAAENEAELAGVMAHEIAHVAARHGVEQASKAQLANIAIIPLIFMSGGLGALAYNAAQIGVPLAFLKFSRGMEAEADMLGAEYMWAAGYDPGYLIKFFEKLEKKEKDRPGTLSKLFRTHPPTPDRIEKLKGLIGRFPDREEYVITRSEFDLVKKRLIGLTKGKAVEGKGGSNRPTLKRRREGGGDKPDEQPKEKPTLKRQDGDSKPPLY